jgi:8-oxo-dGTP pyrophosphatase MutT (NUDIX family)/Txe/YoeB family toxin of Txe-Axe toxin-antitoxin module
MPVAVSRKQYRMMMAIAHGAHVKDGPRGRPPKSVAEKYTSPGKNAPEQSGEDRGGTWSKEHHERHAEKHKKSKKHLKKSFEDYYKGKAAAAIVMDANNRILLGSHVNGGIAFAGGHVDASDPNYDVAALRELKEESGLVGRNPQKIYEFKSNGNDCHVFLVESFSGTPKSTEEVKNWKWYEPQDIPWDKLRDCCHEPLSNFIKQKLGKSLKGMLAVEALEKNVIRQRSDAVFEVTHGDALRLVGNGLFRRIREAVRDMKDEDFKDVNFDTYTVSIRKHISDVYSGRVSDGHKVIYQFTNKSLPEITAALMSVFEWYLPEDEKELDLLDDSALSDDAIKGGLSSLIENYKRHNIGNIYQEMETIREQMRNGVAVDLQQVEGRIMKLFDKLEVLVQEVAGKHNKLAEDAGKEIDEIERKLRDLQSKMDEIEKRPETIEAYSSTTPTGADKIHDENYPYLPRPQIEILPTGKIKISFAGEWTSLERENFLRDMKARAIKKASRADDK